MLTQEHFNVVEHRTIKGAALGQTDTAQRFHQVLGLDVLVAINLEALDRRALMYDNHEHIAVLANFNIVEQTLVIQ